MTSEDGTGDGIEYWRRWIGHTRTSEDLLVPGPAMRLAASLDRAEPLAEGDPLPALWHWIYFLEASPRAETGPDGHPRRGGFMPPVTLPRRMFAGGRMSWHEGGLRIGERAEKTDTILDVTEKTGRSGRLAFVKVACEFRVGGALRLREERDIVYREPPSGPAPAEAPAEPETGPWRADVAPDPMLLFRYSALTFNVHRIHYDRPYATGEEGYPGLVVHGPLIATLLADLFRDHAGKPIARFSFRALRPLFDTAPFQVTGWPGDGGPARLLALTPAGNPAMEAEAEAEAAGTRP